MFKSRLSRSFALLTASLALAASVLYMGAASAQTPSATGASPPPCFPLINGSHPIGPRAVIGQVGLHVFWACTGNVTKPAGVYGFSVPIEKAEQWHHLTAAVHEISRATAKVSTAQRLYSEAFRYDCPDVVKEQSSRGRLCRERDRMLAENSDRWLAENR